MAKTAILAIKILSDATGAVKGFELAGASASKFERRMGVASKAAKIVGAGLLGAAVASRKYASDLQQANGAAQAVFGSQTKAVQKYARGAASSLGLARSEYTQTAAVVGSQLKNMGVSTSQLVPQTDKLIRLGGDLAATYGGTTSDAVAALSSLLRGETDPIEKYGVSIKQADVAAQLAASGTDKLTGAAGKAAKTEALLALLTKQTTAAQGQRAREAGSDAQRQEVAIAKMKDAAAKFGTALLPIFTALSTIMASIAGFAQKHNTAFTILAGVAAGLAAAILVVDGAYKVYTASTRVMTAVTKGAAIAQKAFNLVMRANPIGLVITAIALLVAGFILAYKKSETFRKIVQAVGTAGRTALGWIVTKAQELWKKIQSLAPAAKVVKDAFVGYFKLITAPIRIAIDLIKDLVGWIKNIDFPSAPAWVSRLFGRGGAPAVTTYAAASRTAYSSLPGRGGPGGGGFLTSMGGSRGGTTLVNITVEGALDPEGVARQIGKLLRQQNIRLGGSY